MRTLECPNDINYEGGGLPRDWVFLAGGISNCPDWQKEMIARFKDQDDDLLLINPRRATFDINNPLEASFQIEWERRYLNGSDAILFWFPYHTLCPITLFELGAAAVNYNRSPIFVGCHPGYQRKFDVEKQLSLIEPRVNVRSTFEDLVSDVKEWLNNK